MNKNRFFIYLWAVFVPSAILLILWGLTYRTEQTLLGLFQEALLPVIIRYQGYASLRECVQYSHPNPFLVYFLAASFWLLRTLIHWIKSPDKKMLLKTLFVGWVVCGPPGWIIVGMLIWGGPYPCNPQDPGYDPSYRSYPYQGR